jgi:hypothetical protein
LITSIPTASNIKLAIIAARRAYPFSLDSIMTTIKITTLNNEKGFALLAAIIASLILLAVGMLVINMAVGDLAATSMTVGNRKALAATESAVHRLIQDFNPDGTTWTAANNYTTDCATNPTNPSYIWRSIPGGTDTNTRFAVCAPTGSSMPLIPFPGSALGEWGMMRYDVVVVGQNTTYNSQDSVTVGIGYGPVPMK